MTQHTVDRRGRLILSPTDCAWIILLTLTPREEQMMRLRYGLGVDRIPTLQAIGERFGVGRERVRQILAKAQRKLKHPRRVEMAYELMENSLHGWCGGNSGS